MDGRSRGISPILNYGRSATIAQRGTTICGSEAGRRHRSARCTCAPTNSISVQSRFGFDGCWSALLDLCAGKMTHPIDQPATWRRLRAREAAPDQDRAGSAPSLSTSAANSRPVTAVRCPKILCAGDALALVLKGGRVMSYRREIALAALRVAFLVFRLTISKRLCATVLPLKVQSFA
jgi:hypothetical protein